MSVAAIINEIRKDDDEPYYVPVATETVFKKYWLAASEELNLQWIPLFQSGTVVKKEDVDSVMEEIEKVKNWIIKSDESSDFKECLINRIRFILDMIPKAFERENVVSLWIG